MTDRFQRAHYPHGTLLAHKEKFRQKLIEALAKKYSLGPHEVEEEHKEFIEQYIADKYEPVEQLIEKINVMERPVILNIRRSRSREDKCKLCEANQPNIDELKRIIREQYRDRRGHRGQTRRRSALPVNYLKLTK